MSTPPPEHIDIKKDRGLTIAWPDGGGAFYSVNYLRRLSPSAEMRELRREMISNPLTVLPSGPAAGSQLTIVDAELVGNYAIRIVFSDGHATGLYTWDYLREIDPNRPEGDNPDLTAAPRDAAAPHADPLGLGGSGATEPRPDA